jgi:hypothetical protein
MTIGNKTSFFYKENSVYSVQAISFNARITSFVAIGIDSSLPESCCSESKLTSLVEIQSAWKLLRFPWQQPPLKP